MEGLIASGGIDDHLHSDIQTDGQKVCVRA
jgi:hypothetical protein